MVLSGGIGQEFITGVFNHAEILLIIMDIDLMFSDDERESFGEIWFHLTLYSVCHTYTIPNQIEVLLEQVFCDHCGKEILNADIYNVKIYGILYTSNIYK